MLIILPRLFSFIGSIHRYDIYLLILTWDHFISLRVDIEQL
jgi:hypothetical protein